MHSETVVHLRLRQTRFCEMARSRRFVLRLWPLAPIVVFMRPRAAFPTVIALTALGLAAALLIAGDRRHELCRAGDWWQELWFPIVPLLVMVGIGMSLASRRRRNAALLAVPAAVLIVVWFLMLGNFAGVCAN